MFKKYSKSKKDRYKYVSYFISFTKCNKFCNNFLNLLFILFIVFLWSTNKNMNNK